MALNYSLIFLVCSDRMIECFYVKNTALKTEGFGGIVKLCATLAKQFGGWSRLKALLLLLNNSSLRHTASKYCKCVPTKHVHESTQQCISHS